MGTQWWRMGGWARGADVPPWVCFWFAPTCPFVQVVYFSLLFLPRSFCIEYSYDCIPMIHSANDPRTLPSLLFLLASSLSLLHLARHRKRAATFACGWLFFPWLLVSHLPLQLGTLIAERAMYLPSIGGVLLLSHAIQRLRPSATLLSRKGRAGWAVGIGLCVGYLAALTLRRNLDWRSDHTAFEAGVRICPRSAKVLPLPSPQPSHQTSSSAYSW